MAFADLRDPAGADDSNWLPASNFLVSPFTGWTRSHWVALAEHLLNGAVGYMNRASSLIAFPGHASVNGKRSDAFEGFVRTLMLLSFRVHAEPETFTHKLVDRYVSGLRYGPFGKHDEAWPRLDTRKQSVVEGAGLAIALCFSRHVIWDKLGETDRARLVDWFEGAHSHPAPNDNNRVLFPGVINAFLKSAGAPYNEDQINHALEMTEKLYVGDGWYTDGGERNFDYYNAWALHFYPPLIAHMSGNVSALETFRKRLGEFICDHEYFFDGRGAPVYYGRSLTYRFAAATALWMGAWLNVPGVSPGKLRRTASGCAEYFVSSGAIDDGLMSLGWKGRRPEIAQYYSGPASPYWAAKGCFGLVMDATHPVWTSVEGPMPIEKDDFRRDIPKAGIVLSGQRSSGVVQMYPYDATHDYLWNDNAYNRMQYSSATAPVPSNRPEADANIVLRGHWGQWALRKVSGTVTDTGVIESNYVATARVPGRRLGSLINRKLPVRANVTTRLSLDNGWQLWSIEIESKSNVLIRCGAPSIANYGETSVAGEKGLSATVSSSELMSKIVGIKQFATSGVTRGTRHVFGATWAYPWIAARQQKGKSRYVFAIELANGDPTQVIDLTEKDRVPHHG